MAYARGAPVSEEKKDLVPETKTEEGHKCPFCRIKEVDWKGIFISCLWAFPILLGLDLLSKWLVQLNLDPGQEIPIISNFLYITLVYNTGSAGGAGAGNFGMRIFYIIVSWAMSIVFIYCLFRFRKKKDLFLNIILILCLSGAVGNLIDRTFYWPETVGFSGVIDFIEVYLQGGPNGPSIAWMSPFPIFNLADSYLVIGVILFIIYMILAAIKERKKESQDDE